MRDACCTATIAVAHMTSPERILGDLAFAPPTVSAQPQPRAHPRARAGVRPHARRHRPQRPARRVPRACRAAAVTTTSDPSPRVIRTIRTSPAAARRRAWSYATVRPQPITRPHGSSGDAPTRANHAKPSSDLRPGATDARLTTRTHRHRRADHNGAHLATRRTLKRPSAACAPAADRAAQPQSTPPPSLLNPCPRPENRPLLAPGCPC